MKKSILQIQPQYAQSEEWAAIAQQEGLFYEPVEFFMPQVLKDPLITDTVKAWYRSSGRVKSLHGAFVDVNPASGDPLFQQISMDRCHESCRLAKDLGADYVVFHSSCFPFLRGAYLDHWAAVCAKFYTELARQYNLMICVENSLDVDTTPLCALMNRVTDGRVGVCLDIGHANYSNAPMEAWFDQLGDHIAYLHLSDNMGKFDDHLPLGEGTVNWKQIDDLWRKLNRETPVTLEVGGIKGVEKSLAYLKQNSFFETEE